MVIEALVGMLGSAFVQRMFVAGLCAGLVAPLVGTFLVHRRMALVGDALAHTAFAGVALGLFAAGAGLAVVSPAVTALVVAILAALGIQLVAEYTDAYGDVAMAIFLTGGFAVGSVIIGLSDGGISVGITEYLWGNLALVTRESVRLLVVLATLVVLVVGVTYRQLLFVTFDERAARVAGLPVTWYTRLLVVLTAVVVVAAMQVMGVILVAALIVVPVAAATQLATSFRMALVGSVLAAELSVVVGISLSYLSNLPTGGTIVLVAIAVFLLAAALARVVGQPVRSGPG